ncbi:glycoside hydrolase family 47 protein, partial [Labilibaculum sp.]|uniref:glycoside hydrolase family 47 protein n=1 Tax=Labilibaculum sp. TaxID=2060723 RepID=UPI0035680E6B
MKKLSYFLLILFVAAVACQPKVEKKKEVKISAVAQEVKDEFVRSWDTYKKYAWGHDVLLPLSKSYQDWYKESLHISPIDAYSTMKVMGLDEQAKEV